MCCGQLRADTDTFSNTTLRAQELCELELNLLSKEQNQALEAAGQAPFPIFPGKSLLTMTAEQDKE